MSVRGSSTSHKNDATAQRFWAEALKAPPGRPDNGLTIQELSEKYGTTYATTRRRVAALVKDGKVRKVEGRQGPLRSVTMFYVPV